MTRNQIEYLNYLETKRSNETNESIKLKSLNEDSRHNRATEKETSRSNVARELETNRSNLATEAETRRANMAREQETKRHNQVYEINLFNTLSETIRHNMVGESLSRDSLAETKRHNLVYESYQDRVLDENIRHNMANEGYQMAALRETSRHNQQTESLQGYANKIAQYNADISQQRINNDFYIAKESNAIRDRETYIKEMDADWKWGTNTTGQSNWLSSTFGPILYDARTFLRNLF